MAGFGPGGVGPGVKEERIYIGQPEPTADKDGENEE
jgi:hypothetical protein